MRQWELRDRGTAFVLDASALLAMLHEEAGSEVVEIVISNSVMSTVNWSEVVQKTVARGIASEGLRRDVESLGLVLLPFQAEDADFAGTLWAQTKELGLSLGDRACLALAHRLSLPAMTTDRAWKDLPRELGIEVELAR